MSELVWTVKESLVSYILTGAEGTVTVDGGVTGEPSGPYRFSSEGDALPSVGDEPLRFEGSVHFRGHGGLLDLPLKSLWIESTTTGYALTIEDPDEPSERLVFATIASFQPEGDGLRAGATALTLDGSDLFFGPYSEGTEFDSPFLVGVRAAS